MSHLAMVERARHGAFEDRRRRTRDKAIEEHRHAGDPRRQYSAGDRSQFASAEASQQFEWVASLAGVAVARASDDLDLAGQHRIVDTRAATGPICSRAAEKAETEGRGGGRIADAHRAEAKKVDARFDRHHSVSHGERTVGLAERPALGKVGRRPLEGHLVDPEIGIDMTAQLIDRRAAVDETLHHLRRDLRWISRNAVTDDAMIAGEYRQARTIDAGRVPPLPRRQPRDQFFEPAQGPGRFDQPLLALRGAGRSLGIGVGQFGQQLSKIVEGWLRLIGHGRSPEEVPGKPPAALASYAETCHKVAMRGDDFLIRYREIFGEWLADFRIAAGLGAAIALLCLAPVTLALAAALVFAAGWVGMRLARAQIGGYTGDALGATEQGAEIVVLFAAVGMS